MITIIRGDRRSGKTHRAIEMAKSKGVPWFYVVRHGCVASARKTWPGLNVRSIRTPGLAKRGVSLFVIDDAHRMQPEKLAQFIFAGSEVFLVCSRMIPDWLRCIEQVKGLVRVIDLKAGTNPHVRRVMATLDPGACR